jgi:hypothetical protein
LASLIGLEKDAHLWRCALAASFSAFAAALSCSLLYALSTCIVGSLLANALTMQWQDTSVLFEDGCTRPDVYLQRWLSVKLSESAAALFFPFHGCPALSNVKCSAR